jgi:hypothetical protein
MSPGNRAIEQIFEVLEKEREEDERAIEEGRDPPEREPFVYVEHVPADTLPGLGL